MFEAMYEAKPIFTDCAKPYVSQVSCFTDSFFPSNEMPYLQTVTSSSNAGKEAVGVPASYCSKMPTCVSVVEVYKGTLLPVTRGAFC